MKIVKIVKKQKHTNHFCTTETLTSINFVDKNNNFVGFETDDTGFYFNLYNGIENYKKNIEIKENDGKLYKTLEFVFENKEENEFFEISELFHELVIEDIFFVNEYTYGGNFGLKLKNVRTNKRVILEVGCFATGYYGCINNFEFQFDGIKCENKYFDYIRTQEFLNRFKTKFIDDISLIK